MKDFEYRELRKNGAIEFASIDHNKAIKNMMNQKFDDICSFLHKDKEEIAAFQIKRLAELVDYAYLNIPLYKKKYDEIGYQVGSIKTFEDFKKLPILHKEELIAGFPNDIVKSISDFKYSTRSSGSSGKFVTLAVDLQAIYNDTLQGIRQLKTQSFGKYQKEDTVLFIYTCPWWIEDIDGDYKLDYLPTTTEPRDALLHIQKTSPFIISTYPTYLQKLCELNVNLSDFGVGFVIIHSEQSTKKMRDEMSSALGVTVLDEYSSEELTRIALECKSNNYHLEEDACYIEIIDPTSKLEVIEGSGVVVGTNLLNTATPIIRYYQGDIVNIATTKTCDCGNNGRILTKIQGREMDGIISDGEVIAASAFMDLAYNWFLTFNIPIQGMRYQIVQVSEFKIVIYLTEGLYHLSQQDLNTITETLYSLISKKIEVTIEFTDKFIYKSNKFKPVINLIGSNHETI